MFTEVRLSNFKSFQTYTSIELRRITVLIGPNGSGKSSVLQALLMWRESMDRSTFNTKGKILDLGEPQDVIGSAEEPARLGFTVRKDVDLPELTGNGPLVEVETSADAGVGGPRSFTGQVCVKLSGRPLTFAVREDAGGRSSVEPDSYVAGSTQIWFAAGGRLGDLIAVSSRQGQDARQMEALSRDFGQLLTMARRRLENMRFVPPLRGFLSARYDLGVDASTDFAGTAMTEENAGTLATSLEYNEDLRADVSEALQNLTGVTIDRQLVPNRRIAPSSLRPAVSGRPKKVVPTNEGFGTNQLMHLLSQTLVTPAGETILIEEPEIHLHPLAQVKLGLWVANHARALDKQFVITTHSEHFLGGLLWQVQQEVIEPADMAVYQLNLDDAEHTVLQRRTFTQGGTIQGSFTEFFPDPVEIPGWRQFFRGLRGQD